MKSKEKVQNNVLLKKKKEKLNNEQSKKSKIEIKTKYKAPVYQ